VRLESSAFDRTIVSANSLALGLFNESARYPYSQKYEEEEELSIIAFANVPVYTQEVIDDITIRAYDKCPQGFRLDLLYESKEWTDLENNHIALLRRLAALSEFKEYADDTQKVPLSEIWNVFDAIYVAMTECSTTRALGSSRFCSESVASMLGILNEEEWEELRELSHAAEIMKYSNKTAGKLLGGNLVVQIIERMNAASNSTGTSTGLESFYLYSAHYPTILGVFAALDEVPVESEVIPDYATALIFEFYKNDETGEQTVDIMYKPGSGNEEDGSSIHQTVLLDRVCPSNSVCSVSALSSHFSDYSQEMWCRECGNADAGFCARAMISNQGGECSASMLSGSAGLLIGIFSSVAVFGMVFAFSVLRRRKLAGVDSRVASPKHPDASTPTSAGSYA